MRPGRARHAPKVLQLGVHAGAQRLDEAVYRKMRSCHSVIVPLKSLLFFGGSLGEGVLTSPPPSHGAATRHGATISTAICYEIVYPHLHARPFANGSQLLTTSQRCVVRYSSAPHQHFLQLRCGRSSRGGTWRAPPTRAQRLVDPTDAVLARSALFEHGVEPAKSACCQADGLWKNWRPVRLTCA